MPLDFDLNLLAAGFSWFNLESWWAIAQMAMGLGFVIFVHELGHFLVAKACGVKCEKFYVGFDAFDIKIGNTVLIPRAILKKQWGETEYGIGILPLGGYVKMLGQDDNPANAAEERERQMVKKEDAESEEEEYELDPRSYQAKSVFQRMAIISAGVIMNLIFAVIFAAIAYSIGVEYQTAKIGSTIPGSPAWEKNIRPGTEVVSVRSDGQERDHLRFRDDVVSAIAHNGDKQEIKLTVIPPGTDERREIMIKPRTGIIKRRMTKIGLIGIGSGSILTLSDQDPTLVGSAAGIASEDGNGFLPGDHLLKVDEVELKSMAMLREYLAQHHDQPVKFTVQRASTPPSEEGGEPIPGEVVSFEVGSCPMKTVGLEMEFGPILAIQDDSPAVNAGLQMGDQLLKINGEPIGDPVTFSQRLRVFARNNESVALTVQREGGEETISIQPRLPYTTNNFTLAYDQRIAVDELGIAFAVTNKVAHVQSGSTAAEQGMQPGDVLTKIEFEAASEEKKLIEKEKLGYSDASNSISFDETPNAWPAVLTRAIQNRLDDTKIILHFQRDGSEKTAELVPEFSDKYFLDTRGIMPKPDMETHVAESFGEAISLGFRQTKEDATKIYSLLGKLFTGDVSVINLGGPITIAQAATNEALGGPARILLFLTLLSANLAVVNFLPIPVLDGGHMVFLLYEAIFRKPVGEKLQLALSIMGLVFIVGLMLMVMSFDLLRLV